MTDGIANRPYPIRLDELNDWASIHRATSDEARRRFVQFVILDSFAAAEIARSLAFKGGNALRFGYRSPRSTFDLDFTATDIIDDSAVVWTIVDEAVRAGCGTFGIKCRVSSVSRNPPNPERTLPTYVIKIAYALPGDRAFPDFFESTRTAPTVIPVDISFNDVVCETVVVRFEGSSFGLEICTLNDILAEKLRSVLQQVIRNRNRPQDVYDISRILRFESAELDMSKVRAFTIEKCMAREIVFSVESFTDDVRSRSAYGYDELQDDLGANFIPFDEAWAEVVAFVRRLLLPEENNDARARRRVRRLRADRVVWLPDAES